MPGPAEAEERQKRILILTGDLSIECAREFARRGDPDCVWTSCADLALTLKPRWEVRRCNGDAGRYLHGVAQHRNLDAVVRPVFAAMAARMRVVPNAVMKICLIDEHGKHPAVALGCLMQQVFLSGGWEVELAHLSVAYNNAKVHCKCNLLERGNRHPVSCPMVEWGIRAWWLPEPAWGHSATAEWHLEQSRLLGQAALNVWEPFARRLLTEEGVPR